MSRDLERVAGSFPTPERLGDNSTTIAVILVALGETPEHAFLVGQKAGEMFTGRLRGSVASLDDLRRLAERIRE